MIIRRATKPDLPAINALLEPTIMDGITMDYLSDVALVAEQDKDIVGFVWAGLMANKKLAYIDKMVTKPKKAPLSTLPRLLKKLVSILEAEGVVDAFSVICHTGDIQRTVKLMRNAGRYGMVASPMQCAYLYKE